MNQDTFMKYSHFIKDFLISQGMLESWAALLNGVINFIVLLAAFIFLNFLLQKIFVGGFRFFSRKRKSSFNNYLLESKFPKHISRIAVLILIYQMLPVAFADFPKAERFFKIISQVYFIILAVLVIRSILISLRNYLFGKPKWKDKPLDSYVQVIMIFVWGFGLFWTIQLLTGFTITGLAALSAASAVIMLIFKDTILGFVASIQVTINDTVRIGDWITVEKFGADGFVTEINLSTVRIHNWDKTYTTIPTYSLISDSFQNWRGMEESGGRRIKRAFYIKQSSVKFLDENDLEKLKKIQKVKSYIEHRQQDIDRFNERTQADKSLQINGRNQTNLGIFRYYVNTLLNEHTAIHKDLLLLVRYLDPTDKGLPVEIYCFSKERGFVNFQHIQSDIFDHILAAVPYFDLEIFESPTGKDLLSLKQEKPGE